METLNPEELHGQLQALSQTLSAVIASLEPLPAAKVAMHLAMEVESLRKTANRSPQDDVTLELLTAYRDLAHGSR